MRAEGRWLPDAMERPLWPPETLPTELERTCTMRMGEPSPTHRRDCEAASENCCTCQCGGSGHRRDLAERAIRHSQSAVDTLDAAFPVALYELFGPLLSDLLSEPGKNDPPVPRWADGWPGASAQRKSTLCEQRLLDTTLHDVFLHIGDSLAEDGLVRDQSVQVLHRLLPCRDYGLRNDGAEANRYASYLWGSLMAALTNVDLQSVARTIRGHGSIAAHEFRRLVGRPLEDALRSPEYRDIRYPRGVSGSHIHRIEELRPDRAFTETNIRILIRFAKELFDDEGIRHLLRYPNGPEGMRALIEFAGCASSPDLWRHPIAVRLCLIPLARMMAPSLTVKTPRDAISLMDEILVDAWRSHPRTEAA